MTQPTVVAIAGSCTTRDSFNSRFNPDYKQFFRCDLAQNQTSMITLMSEPVEPVFEPLGPMSDYDRWNVRTDLNREFLPLLAELRPTYLILDFFADVHFGVLRLPDGRYLTDNRWKLWKTDYYQRLDESGGFTRIRLAEQPETYLSLWQEATDRFAAFVREQCPDTVVVVHRGWNTDRVLVPGTPRSIPLRRHKKLSPLDVPLANELWARLDDYATGTFGWEVIDLRGLGCPSFVDHPWGPFYVHYTMDYYHRFLAELHKIDLRRHLDPGRYEAVLAVESAAAEPGQRRLAEEQAVVAVQRDRIGELESLSPLQALRFAVGQQLRSRHGQDTAR